MDKISTNKSIAYKTFHKAAASYILGERSNVKIQGSPERIKVTKEVLNASKVLFEELNNPGATLKSVTTLLESKRKASTNFHQVTGIRWLL